MKIIREPRVCVVAATVFYGHPEYLLPGDGDNAVRLGAFAAKGCYDAFGTDGRSNHDNQARIIESGHGSVLEHFNVSLFIEGISRACSHEIVRHRAGFAYSQRSTRYTNEGDSAIVLDPYYASLHNIDPLFTEFLHETKAAIAAYEYQVEELINRNPLGFTGTELRKWARGKARNLLPHALETRMLMTGNLRAWRHFIEMRSERHAEAEIRRLADHVITALRGIAPFYFADYDEQLVDGILEYSTKHRKV
jgi:thymidylate synthase (FAD)